VTLGVTTARWGWMSPGPQHVPWWCYCMFPRRTSIRSDRFGSRQSSMTPSVGGAVPIFFMLSGALLLWREEPILPFYRKRVSRVAVPLVFWTVVYAYIFGDMSTPFAVQVGQYLMVPYGHLWYFYAALGLYFSAPYLGKILRASTEKEILVFLSLWFLVACVLNQIRVLYSVSWDPSILLGGQLFSGYIGYFLLGAYLGRRRPITSGAGKWGCILAFVLSSAAIAYLTYRYSVYLGAPNESFFIYQTPLVAFASIALFSFFTSTVSLPSPLAKVVRLISDCSLGIYCLHPMIIWFYLERLHLGDFIHTTWFKVPILWAAIFSSAAVVIYLARKVPLARRIA
jgi:surface polysaccharide O-acyltransferase-like enzyme